MKTNIKYSFLFPALVAGLNLLPASHVRAQTFTILHSFTAGADDGSGVSTNSDGAGPHAGLISSSSGNTLYGTAQHGGSSDGGTVFAVSPDGTGFTILHSFSAKTGGTNSDGFQPLGRLIMSGNTLYGTAAVGGSGRSGTVFKVNTNGTGFTTLHHFTATACSGCPNSEGASPFAGLLLSGNTLYGTTTHGGSSGLGTVFAVNTDGTDFTNLHSFTGGSDGAAPWGGVILSGNILYGTTTAGGSAARGMVFAVNTDGTGFTNLHSFLGFPIDGNSPSAGLLLLGDTLYGTANGGGSSSRGTVFSLKTDGTGFTNLYSFTTSSAPYFTNSDGQGPQSLILSGNTLYGTAQQGGSATYGTVFAVNTNGTDFTLLHSFTEFFGCYPCTNSDGASPIGGLLLSGNTLYGTAQAGGSSGSGTVFSLSFRPRLTITPSGIPPSGIILSWLTNVAGFDYSGYTLQSATNLDSPVWSTNSPAPVVIGGQNTVTNLISGPQQFYRLVQ